MRLKDKVVLVTASTRGIGLAIVKKCAAEGARVYMAARDMERAQGIAQTLSGTKMCVQRCHETGNFHHYGRRYCSGCRAH